MQIVVNRALVVAVFTGAAGVAAALGKTQLAAFLGSDVAVSVAIAVATTVGTTVAAVLPGQKAA